MRLRSESERRPMVESLAVVTVGRDDRGELVLDCSWSITYDFEATPTVDVEAQTLKEVEVRLLFRGDGLPRLVQPAPATGLADECDGGDR